MTIPSQSPGYKPVDILLIEDDEHDVFLTERAFKKAKVANRLSAVRNGEEALAFLRNEPPFEQATKPDLILLDLNMPRMNGHEVLEIIKHDEKFKVIPVIVMTMSQSEADMMASYQNHANAFIPKPIDFKGFKEVVDSIDIHWFAVVKLPHLS